MDVVHTRNALARYPWDRRIDTPTPGGLKQPDKCAVLKGELKSIAAELAIDTQKLKTLGGTAKTNMQAAINGLESIQKGLLGQIAVVCEPLAGGIGITELPDPISVSTPATCTQTLDGAVLAEWVMLGKTEYGPGVSMQQALGAPLEALQPDGTMRFERGMMYVYDPVTGKPDPANDPDHDDAITVVGELYRRYARSGGISGPLGRPVIEDADYAGGRFQRFDGGLIMTHPDYGTHVLTGPTADWMMPLDASALIPAGAYPISSTTTLDHVGASQTRLADATVFDLPGLGITLIDAAFRNGWELAGGATGYLGLPVGSIHTSASGKRYLDFTGGVLVEWQSGKPVVPVAQLRLFFERCQGGEHGTHGWDPFFGLRIYLQVSCTIDGQPAAGGWGNPPGDDAYKLPVGDGADYGSGAEMDVVGPTIPVVHGATTFDVFIQAMDSRSGPFFHDVGIGQISVTYSIDNLWGQDPSGFPVSFESDKILVELSLQPPPQPYDPNKPWREQEFWSFHNFDAADLTLAQCAETFTDINADDNWLLHPLNRLFYKYIYKECAAHGDCFGMCLASVKAQLQESVYTQPTFHYQNDEAVRGDITIWHGYQLGAPTLNHLVPQLLNGDARSAVKAFTDSQAQYAAGDWPILNLYQPGHGHSVRPYAWTQTTDEWYIEVANPNWPWGLPASGSYTEDDEAPPCRVVINPEKDSWSLQVGGPDDVYSGDASGGLFSKRLIWSVPAHLYDGKPDSLADDWALLLQALAGLIFILADGASAEPAPVRADADPAVALLVPSLQDGDPGGSFWIKPGDETDAAFTVHGRGAVHPIEFGIQTWISYHEVSIDLPDGATDTLTMTGLGTSGQTLAYRADPNKAERTATVTSIHRTGARTTEELTIPPGGVLISTAGACGSAPLVQAHPAGPYLQ